MIEKLSIFICSKKNKDGDIIFFLFFSYLLCKFGQLWVTCSLQNITVTKFKKKHRKNFILTKYTKILYKETYTNSSLKLYIYLYCDSVRMYLMHCILMFPCTDITLQYTIFSIIAMFYIIIHIYMLLLGIFSETACILKYNSYMQFENNCFFVQLLYSFLRIILDSLYILACTFC